ncbi:MAG: hypothetical protein HQL08_00520 [Nitrospirae bacterium]|nr:hypothetical protein [Nitrospirota bacterium]
MQLFVIAISALIVGLALSMTSLNNPANYDTAAVADSLAPEHSLYDGAANITAAANVSMERSRLTSVEQSLVDVCRAIYWMGKNNGCSPLDEGFTWQFMLNQGTTGALNSVLSVPSTSTFSCGSPGQYGAYLLRGVYSDLGGYKYNLNNSTGTGVISGQADPCAYADIVYR